VNTAVRTFCQKTPLLRDIYVTTRTVYNRRRIAKAARSYFVNSEEYCNALKTNDGTVVDVHTTDGLSISIRRNCMDATILAEIFLDRCYTRGLSLPDEPVVVDIGGYIGDFALFAAKCLNARKVVVCEPSPRNWALLQKNVANNHFHGRIITVNKAVTEGKEVMMNVEAPDRGQARVSAYYPTDEQRRMVPVVSLSNLVEQQHLEVIDLLKIDCEGGEYVILSSTPSAVFRRITNIVFEYHEIAGFDAKLRDAKRTLCNEGYALTERGSLVFASRKPSS
jgi:FkbM family methyltransferase